VSLRILDASVAIKWFVPGEAGHAEALRILDDVQDNPDRFAVPELFFNEMLAVLACLQKDEVELRGLLDALQDLGLERIGNGRDLLAVAAALACTYGLTGYDAIYGASAQLVGGCWWTADEKAHHRIRKLRLSKVVCAG